MKCIVPTCEYDFHKRSRRVSRHHFPKNSARRTLWIKAVAYPDPDALNLDSNFDVALICSQHFAPECFKRPPKSHSSPDNKNILRNTAVPTIFGAVKVDVKKLADFHLPELVIISTDGRSPRSNYTSIEQIKTRQLLENALNHTTRKDENGKENDPTATDTTIFRLKKFPHVCRLCLKANSKQSVMVSLATVEPALEGKSIGDYIVGMTSPAVVLDQNKQHLVPRRICLPCLDLLKFFAKYRSKITTVQRLISSLIDVKQHNSGPIVDLFNAESDLIETMIKDLDLCSMDDYSVQDLLDEFSSYELASFEGFNGEEEHAEIQVQKPCEEFAQELVDLPVKEEVEYCEEWNESLQADEQELLEATGSDTDVIKEPSIQIDKKELSEVSGSDTEVIKEASTEENTSTKPKRDNDTKLDVPLKCPKCPHVAYYLKAFQRHLRNHEKRESTSKTYKCKAPGCTKVFTSFIEYRRHGPSAHKRFICDTCGHKSSTSTSLKDHVARHLNKLEYACSYCQQRYNTNTDLRLHVRVVHLAVKKYACETCGMTFRKKATRDEHAAMHSDVYAFECSQCDKKFKRKLLLSNHVNYVHERIRSACPHCDKDFRTSYILNNHIETVHGIKTRFVCDVCVVTYSTQEQLDSHRARHDNPKELECPTCLILFPSNDQLGDHLCITYRDDYVCCGRDLHYHTFYNRHMLLTHGVTTNARVKPIPGQLMARMRAQRKRIETCPKCKKTFATRTLKRQHMEICKGAEEPPREEPTDDRGGEDGGDDRDVDLEMNFKVE